MFLLYNVVCTICALLNIICSVHECNGHLRCAKALHIRSSSYRCFLFRIFSGTSHSKRTSMYLPRGKFPGFSLVRFRRTSIKYSLVLALANVCFVLPWQFAQFALLTQVLAVFALYFLRLTSKKVFSAILIGHAVRSSMIRHRASHTVQICLPIMFSRAISFF